MGGGRAGLEENVVGWGGVRVASGSDRPGFDCCLPQGRSLVWCLGAHMFYSIIRVDV